jgi:hypothetical protein
MNKQFSLLLHSALIVAALLPLSPLASRPLAAVPASADVSQLVAFGNGAPAYRGGGGTR